MSTSTQHYFAYLHGFASGPQTKKGVSLVNRLKNDHNIDVEIPDLNVPSFAQLTYSGSLSAVDALYQQKKKENPDSDVKLNLIGSSMGGYIAARWAELNPDKMNRLLLLCPAFDLQTRWPIAFGEARLKEWKDKGTMPFKNFVDGKEHQVGYALVEEALKHPSYPKVDCPITIIHGRQDVVVPLSTSTKFIEENRSNPSIQMIEVDDGHELMNTLDLITETIVTFLAQKQ